MAYDALHSKCLTALNYQQPFRSFRYKPDKPPLSRLSARKVQMDTLLK